MGEQLKEFQRLKDEIERLKRAGARATGARGELLRRLKEEYDCDTLEDAETLLNRMRKQLATLERRLSEAQEGFDKKWEGKGE